MSWAVCLSRHRLARTAGFTVARLGECQKMISKIGTEVRKSRQLSKWACKVAIYPPSLLLLLACVSTSAPPQLHELSSYTWPHEAATETNLARVKESCGVEITHRIEDKVFNLTFHTLYRSTAMCTAGKHGQVCMTYAINNVTERCVNRFYMSDGFIQSEADPDSLFRASGVKVPERIRSAKSLQVPILASSLKGVLILLETSESIFIF